MSNNLKIIIIVIVLGVLGGGGFLLLNNSESDTDTQNLSNNSSATANGTADTANPFGLDVSSLAGAYRITVVSNENGAKTTAVVDKDDQGNSRITSDGSGNSVTILIVDGSTYLQNDNGGWTKFPAGNSTPNVSSTSRGFSAQDIKDLETQATIVSQGTGSCTAGSCRIFQSTDNGSGEVVILKVDMQTNRLSDMTITSSSGSTTTVTYDFTTPIEITAPEGAVEFGTGGV